VSSFGYSKGFFVISHIIFSILDINVFSIINSKVFGVTIIDKFFSCHSKNKGLTIANMWEK
jgi:hypothetical protein